MFFSWSEIGSYHKNNNEVNQDVIITDENKDIMIATLCDGVSTCRYAREGAEIAGSSVSSFMMGKYHKLLKYDNRTIAEKMVNHICYDLRKEANAKNRNFEDYSSTISSVLYDRENRKLLCLNVGDAIIGGLAEKGIEIIGKPQSGYNGCYVSTTKEVEKVADVSVLDAEKYKSVFICTDGMWKAFYNGKKISGDTEEKIETKAYDELVNYIRLKPNSDDRSIVIMELKEKNA